MRSIMDDGANAPADGLAADAAAAASNNNTETDDDPETLVQRKSCNNNNGYGNNQTVNNLKTGHHYGLKNENCSCQNNLNSRPPNNLANNSYSSPPDANELSSATNENCANLANECNNNDLLKSNSPTSVVAAADDGGTRNAPSPHAAYEMLQSNHSSLNIVTTTNVIKLFNSINDESMNDGPINNRTIETSKEEQVRSKQRIVVKKFQKFDSIALSSTPAPDVKIGQRVAYKEYYGNEFGTIRWIGRVPQISADWTVGVEFDNAIGEGDGSLNGRRYFIAKDCFAKFLPLNNVALVEQHVGRPEPGTMISVMSAAVRPGQMISIQRVSTVHVQHCFLNAPHHRPGADILAVNTRLHCQCPNCGPCAHVVKPPRTQRLRSGKNATHMCQFSTYTCCGMESQEEAMCTYTGNKISSLPPPESRATTCRLPPIGNSWIEGSGYLTNLQKEQSKLMPDEYRLGLGPADYQPTTTYLGVTGGGGGGDGGVSGGGSERSSSRRAKHHRHHHHHHHHRKLRETTQSSNESTPIYANYQGDRPKSSELASELCQDCSLSPQPPPPPTMTTTANDNTDTALINELAVAIPEKTSLVCNNQVDDGEHPPEISSGQQQHHHHQEEKPKSGRILYRDSIENRYLFPTDEDDVNNNNNDPIDSTLEADLENLSQARYGHGPNVRSVGPRNLFKSLRSLVSCLNSANSTKSDFGAQSETNTMRVYEQPQTAANGNNSQPTTRAVSSTTSYCDSDLPLPCAQPTGKISPSHYDTHFDFLKHHQQQPLNGWEQQHHCKHHQDCANYHNYGRPKVFPDFRSPQSPSGARAEGGREKLDSYASSGSGNNIATTTTTTTFEQFRRQISSSSDCGFSSASQNSINLHSYPSCSPIIFASATAATAATTTTTTTATAAAAATTKVDEDEEQRNLNRIYNCIVDKLISSAPETAPITSEDLLKLKRALFETQQHHSRSCCLHMSHTHHNHSQQNVDHSASEISDCDQLIADIIKRAYLRSSACSNENVQNVCRPLHARNLSTHYPLLQRTLSAACCQQQYESQPDCLCRSSGSIRTATNDSNNNEDEDDDNENSKQGVGVGNAHYSSHRHHCLNSQTSTANERHQPFGGEFQNGGKCQCSNKCHTHSGEGNLFPNETAASFGCSATDLPRLASGGSNSRASCPSQVGGAATNEDITQQEFNNKRVNTNGLMPPSSNASNTNTSDSNLSLPKTFELKLTLSINNSEEKKTTITASNGGGCSRSGENNSTTISQGADGKPNEQPQLLDLNVSGQSDSSRANPCVASNNPENATDTNELQQWNSAAQQNQLPPV